uniref:Autophagy protein 5 n=1 Tax=Steinernema glaseri TaxID=37863 RepID=A0A1I8AAQ4_9BILA
MSSQDYEVMRKVWELRIPVQFRLDHDAGHHTEPYFTMLSRSTYFPLVIREVIAHFNTMTSELDPSNAWLECDGTPLKWNYPVGVLYDMLTVQEHTPYLPWTVTVKLSSPPPGFSVKVSTDAAEANFMHSVKEADCLKHERMLMKEMKMQEHKQMWEGLVNDRFDQFWEVNRKLCGDVKYLPIRFYEKDVPFKQIRLTPVDENGAKRTLGDCVAALHGDFDVSAFDLISYGVVLPPEASALWLARNYSYPDNFVHVAIVKKPQA